MKYFLHDTNAFQDEKITELFMAHGYAGLGLFYSILEKLAQQEKPIKTVVLKKQLSVGKKLEKCWAYLESLQLISSNNGETFNDNLLKFSEKYQVLKEKNRERVAQWREKQADTKPVTHYEQVRNSPKVKESKVKEIVGKPTYADSAAPSSAVLALKAEKEKEKELDFTSFWLAYHDNLPKRGSKSKAKAKWQTLSAATRALIIAGLEAHRADATRNGPDYLPYATTFLSEKRWESETYGQAPPPVYQTPNQVPGNWNTASQGAYTAPMGQGIPHPSSYLKPEFQIN